MTAIPQQPAGKLPTKIIDMDSQRDLSTFDPGNVHVLVNELLVIEGYSRSIHESLLYFCSTQGIVIDREIYRTNTVTVPMTGVRPLNTSKVTLSRSSTGGWCLINGVPIITTLAFMWEFHPSTFI